MENYCKNCGAKLDSDDEFCPDCGSKTDKINFCPNCGAKLANSVNFCESCGNKINKRSFTLDNAKIILVLLGFIVATLACLTLFAGGVFDTAVPLETTDFEIFTMLTPVGSDYVTTDSLPSYGIVGGYVVMENGGDYSEEVQSITVDNIRGTSHPPQVSFDHRVGDITVYKDNQGNNKYYIDRQVGEYEVSLIGSDDETMIEMLESIELS